MNRFLFLVIAAAGISVFATTRKAAPDRPVDKIETMAPVAKTEINKPSEKRAVVSISKPANQTETPSTSLKQKPVGSTLNRTIGTKVYRASDWENPAQQDDAITLNKMFADLPSNSTVMLDKGKTYRLASKIVLPKPVYLKGNNAIFNYSGPASIVVSIQSSDVTIDGLTVTGDSRDYTVSSGLIQSENSTNNSFYKNITIKNSTLHGYRDAGIRLYYTQNVSITGNTIYDLPYGGVILFSCIDGKIEDNTITDITAIGTSGGNAYGIEVLRQVSKGSDEVPRNIVIRRNIIKRVPWEGIDTHGGMQLTISDNKVFNCKKGIAMVSTGGLAPKDIVIANNFIDNDSLNVATKASIAIEGLPDYKATGIVIRNNTSFGAGIKIQYTDGTLISNNTVKRASGGFGVLFDAPNVGAAVIANTFRDVYSTGSKTAGIKTAGALGNEVYIVGNSLGDEGFTPPGKGNKNRFGFRANTPGQVNDKVTLYGNDFNAAAESAVGNAANARFDMDDDDDDRGQGRGKAKGRKSFMGTGGRKYIICESGDDGSVSIPALSASTDKLDIVVFNKTNRSMKTTSPVWDEDSQSSTYTISAGSVVRLVYDYKAGKIRKS